MDIIQNIRGREMGPASLVQILTELSWKHQVSRHRRTLSIDKPDNRDKTIDRIARHNRH